MSDASLLVTGFEPFGGERVNASHSVVECLRESSALPLATRILPVEFDAGPACLRAAIDELRPSGVLCLGEAGGRAEITVETRAHHLADARIPDNAHAQPRGVLLDDGPEWLATSVCVPDVVRAICRDGIRASVSSDAGRYVCNAVYRTALNLRSDALFIHVPAIRAVGAARIGSETDDDVGVGQEARGGSPLVPAVTLAEAARAVTIAASYLLEARSIAPCRIGEER